MCTKRESSYNSFTLIFFSSPPTSYSDVSVVLYCIPSYLQIRIQPKGDEKKRIQKRMWIVACHSTDRRCLCSWYWQGFTTSCAKDISQPWSLRGRIIREGVPAPFLVPRILGFVAYEFSSNYLHDGRDVCTGCDLSDVNLWILILWWEQRTYTSQKKVFPIHVRMQ